MNKNILFVVPSMESGGVEAGILEIAKRNNERKDFNMFVLTSGGNLVNKLKMYKVNCVILNVKTKNPLKIFLNIGKIKKVIKQFKIDIVQVESRAPAWSCSSACSSLNIPMITTIHGVYETKLGLFGMFSFLKKWYNSIMFRSDAIVCVSSYVRNFILKHYKSYIHKKDSLARIEVIHRGIDTNLFSKESVSVSRLLAVQKELGLPEDKLLITLPARFSKQKGQDYFLKVLKFLKSTNYVCVLVGDIYKKPEYVKYLKKLIYRFKLQNNVIIHDNITDIQALYYLSSVVVSSSVKPESFGRVAIEAQSMEKIFVGTAIGGTLETVVDGKTGFLVPVNNEKIFAKFIDKALNMDDKERKEITSLARNNVIENFSLDKCYESLLKIYENINKE